MSYKSLPASFLGTRRQSSYKPIILNKSLLICSIGVVIVCRNNDLSLIYRLFVRCLYPKNYGGITPVGGIKATGSFD
jgi:hypothetical protein